MSTTHWVAPGWSMDPAFLEKATEPIFRHTFLGPSGSIVLEFTLTDALRWGLLAEVADCRGHRAAALAFLLGVDAMTVGRWLKAECEPQGLNRRALLEYIATPEIVELSRTACTPETNAMLGAASIVADQTADEIMQHLWECGAPCEPSVASLQAHRGFSRAFGEMLRIHLSRLGLTVEQIALRMSDARRQ